MGNWEDWEEENCLEGRRRRLMRRGTRATREEGGEGERGEGKEDESSLRFVVEKALLFVATDAWVIVFFRFVCLDRAIPVQGRVATGSCSRSLAAPSLRNRFFGINPFDPLRPPMRQQTRGERESEGLFLSGIYACRCRYPLLVQPFPPGSAKQMKTAGTTERT